MWIPGMAYFWNTWTSRGGNHNHAIVKYPSHIAVRMNWSFILCITLLPHDWIIAWMCRCVSIKVCFIMSSIKECILRFQVKYTSSIDTPFMVPPQWQVNTVLRVYFDDQSEYSSNRVRKPELIHTHFLAYNQVEYLSWHKVHLAVTLIICVVKHSSYWISHLKCPTNSCYF